MFDGRKPCARASGYALSRRIGSNEIGIFRFEPFELVQETIELGVGNFRAVVKVIPLFVVADLAA